MAFENYQDMRQGDVIECYRVETDSTQPVSPISLLRRLSNHPPNSTVMPDLVPGIHAFLQQGSKTWRPGTSPAVTT